MYDKHGEHDIHFNKTGNDWAAKFIAYEFLEGRGKSMKDAMDELFRARERALKPPTEVVIYTTDSGIGMLFNTAIPYAYTKSPFSTHSQEFRRRDLAESFIRNCIGGCQEAKLYGLVYNGRNVTCNGVTVPYGPLKEVAEQLIEKGVAKKEQVWLSTPNGQTTTKNGRTIEVRNCCYNVQSVGNGVSNLFKDQDGAKYHVKHMNLDFRVLITRENCYAAWAGDSLLCRNQDLEACKKRALELV